MVEVVMLLAVRKRLEITACFKSSQARTWVRASKRRFYAVQMKSFHREFSGMVAHRDSGRITAAPTESGGRGRGGKPDMKSGRHDVRNGRECETQPTPRKYRTLPS